MSRAWKDIYATIVEMDDNTIRPTTYLEYHQELESKLENLLVEIHSLPKGDIYEVAGEIATLAMWLMRDSSKDS